MRENRLSGLEGGGGGHVRSPYPYRQLHDAPLQQYPDNLALTLGPTA
jgi:hypothetical protein